MKANVLLRRYSRWCWTSVDLPQADDFSITFSARTLVNLFTNLGKNVGEHKCAQNPNNEESSRCDEICSPHIEQRKRHARQRLPSDIDMTFRAENVISMGPKLWKPWKKRTTTKKNSQEFRLSCKKNVTNLISFNDFTGRWAELCVLCSGGIICFFGRN